MAAKMSNVESYLIKTFSGACGGSASVCFCLTCGLSTPPFWLVIGNQHLKESVDSTVQKIYAKVYNQTLFCHHKLKWKNWSDYARLELHEQTNKLKKSAAAFHLIKFTLLLMLLFT